jgi:hypothetical protein
LQSRKKSHPLGGGLDVIALAVRFSSDVLLP